MSWGNYKYLINGAYPKFKNGKNVLELDRGPGFSGNDPTHPEVSGVIIITGMRDLPRDPRGVPNPFPMFPTGPPENILDFRGSKFDQNPNRPRQSIGNRLKFHMD